MKIKTAHRLEIVSEYYFSRKLKEIAALRQQGVDVVNLGIGSPDMAPAEEVIETVVSESRKPENHAYQSYSGIPALREAYANWYREFFDVQLDPDNEILPLMGSKEGIMHISWLFSIRAMKYWFPIRAIRLIRQWHGCWERAFAILI